MPAGDQCAWLYTCFTGARDGLRPVLPPVDDDAQPIAEEVLCLPLPALM